MRVDRKKRSYKSGLKKFVLVETRVKQFPSPRKCNFSSLLRLESRQNLGESVEEDGKSSLSTFEIERRQDFGKLILERRR